VGNAISLIRQGDRRFIDPNGNRVAAEQTLMQHLDPRSFDKPQLDQPTLELGSRQPVIADANQDSPDPALEPDHSGAERLRSARTRVVAGYACSSGHVLRSEAYSKVLRLAFICKYVRSPNPASNKRCTDGFHSHCSALFAIQVSDQRERRVRHVPVLSLF
jgi:hypothetical protein